MGSGQVKRHRKLQASRVHTNPTTGLASEALLYDRLSSRSSGLERAALFYRASIFFFPPFLREHFSHVCRSGVRIVEQEAVWLEKTCRNANWWREWPVRKPEYTFSGESQLPKIRCFFMPNTHGVVIYGIRLVGLAIAIVAAFFTGPSAFRLLAKILNVMFEAEPEPLASARSICPHGSLGAP